MVLNASRPDRRKRVDLTVKGFAQFAADKPANVRLCLHHAIMDEASERELRSVIQQCGIAERVSLNPLGNGVAADDDLNLLYNACDVGINTSMGEGWGLVTIEHGAAGAPQIVPDHTACAELWGRPRRADSAGPELRPGVLGARDGRSLTRRASPGPWSRSTAIRARRQELARRRRRVRPQPGALVGRHHPAIRRSVRRARWQPGTIAYQMT